MNFARVYNIVKLESNMEIRNKISVNDPCPCGSKRKWKKCHPDSYDKWGRLKPPPEVLAMASVIKEIQAPFEKGDFLIGRPFIDIVHKGKRFRAVGGSIYQRPIDETFHEFLFYFLSKSIGEKWLNAEIQNKTDRHPVAEWWHELHQAMQVKVPTKENSAVNFLKKTGNIRSLLALSYDFYTLAHCGGTVFPNLIKRFKNNDFFQSHKYELVAAAIAIRAGFDITWLNGKEKHVEFIGVHRITKEEIAFEAKSHHRLEKVNDTEAVNTRIKIMDHIHEAIEQSPKDKPLVIFDDLNLPLSTIKEKQWFRDVDEELKKYDFVNYYKQTNLGMVLITNFSWHFHSNLDDYQKNEMMSVFHIGNSFSLSPQVISYLDIASKQYGYVPSKVKEEFGVTSAQF